MQKDFVIIRDKKDGKELQRVDVTNVLDGNLKGIIDGLRQAHPQAKIELTPSVEDRLAKDDEE